jgi:penicillin amidase
MKIFKSVLFLVITIGLIYFFNSSWNIGGAPVPPLGKFLDPFHGFWQSAESENPLQQTLNLPGLKEPVTIHYDSMMIPHIFANNDEDLYLAQGYITAQHRLWQMEIQVYAAAGRVSEILGSNLLNRDRRQRRLGMVYGAENCLAMMEKDPAVTSMITKYTEGVNAYINTLDYDNLPFEYKLLDYRPEPWTNLKIALLKMNMAQTLNMGDKDVEMTNFVSMFGKETADILFPDHELSTDMIVDNTNNWKFKPIRIDSLPIAIPKNAIRSTEEEKPSRNVGSNNWAVSGSRTASGSPLLCNDPHLTLSLPSIWYVVHLSAPGVNTMGGSLAGAPTVVIGFNDSIAWGITNGQRDAIDYYEIQWKDTATMTEYLSDGQWKKADLVVEKFDIKGADPFYDTIRFTHHGPVTYDKNFNRNAERKNLAFRWISHDASMEFLTFHKLNRGKNYGDYMDALNYFHTPAQNIVFASVAGDIAMRVQGKFPVRRQDEGKFVLDGTNTGLEWHAWIPNEQNAMQLNPARGFVSSANQHPADATYPYYVTATSYEVYRNRQINRVLSKLDKATVADMMKLQFDTYNINAEENLPWWLEQVDSLPMNEQEQKAITALKSWNYRNDVDEVGASYYDAWHDVLWPLAWDELEIDGYALYRPTEYTTFKLMKEQPALSFFDIASTPEKETAKELLRKAFSLSVQDVEKWKSQHNDMEPKWGDYKGSYVGHLLGQQSLGIPVRHGGHGDVVNAHTRTHGPSWRMVVSLEKTGVKAWGVYPGGQSGNAGSPFYANMLDMWTKGQYFRLPFLSKEELSKCAIFTTEVSPAK